MGSAIPPNDFLWKFVLDFLIKACYIVHSEEGAHMILMLHVTEFTVLRIRGGFPRARSAPTG